MKRLAFDNEKYVQMQSAKIKERIKQFDNKLYLEFGGKLFDDYHASRVLPGFQPDSKIKMLMELRDSVEIVIVINATDIEKNKVRSDLGITYDLDGDAQIAPYLIFLNIRGVDDDDDFRLFLELEQHVHLTVRLKARKHPGSVKVVKQFAAEFQVQLAAELVDALPYLLRLQL